MFTLPLGFSHSSIPLFPLGFSQSPFPVPSPSRFLSFPHSSVPSWFLSFPFPCFLSLSVSLMPLFPVGFPLFPLCFSRHLCTKKQRFKTKKQDKRSKIQGATGLLLPSSPPSLPRLLVLITLRLEKKKRARVDFQRFHPGYGGWIRGWGNREGLLFAGEVWGFCFD